ncbi:MFS transporter [Pseudonocardiaceae bacterium YIM PH 21723]|nr:MFS transporter [Pseudonocardiaceae bacterium YIM PH 21723]
MATTEVPAARPGYENRLLAILFLAFGLVFFDRQALLFLAPYVTKDLGLTNTQLGAVSGVLALTWAVAGMVTGRLSDRLAVRKPILVAAVILFSVASAAAGLTTGFIGLLVARGLMGFAEGAVLPVSQSLMLDASQEHRRGLNMGLVQGSSAGLLGGIVAPLLVVWTAEQWGWRAALLLTILPGLLLTVWVIRSVRDIPKVPKENREPTPPLWSVLGKRNVLLCTLIACCYLTWFIVIITFAPTYLVTVKGFSPGTMSLVMTCFGIAWVIWGFVTPAISDRIGRRTTMIVFTAIAAVCPIAVVYVADPVWLGIIVVVTYTGLGCFTLFMATIPAETVPVTALATALGVVMGVGELAGGFLAPVIAGAAADAWGLTSALYISAGGAVLAMLLSFGLIETAPAVLRRRAG